MVLTAHQAAVTTPAARIAPRPINPAWLRRAATRDGNLGPHSAMAKTAAINASNDQKTSCVNYPTGYLNCNAVPKTDPTVRSAQMPSAAGATAAKGTTG